MGGVAIVFLIIILAGGIAYVGDRVGHQVGRKRLTLFGLRPKYTSTIVAVGTGMLIALVVTGGALISSAVVRTAFFKLGTINARINELQQQSLALENELESKRNNALSVRKFALIAPRVWSFDLTKSDESQLTGPLGLYAFFDAVVQVANANFATKRFGLEANTHRSSEPETQAKLRQELEQVRSTFGPGAQVLFVPVAAENLFRGEVIGFQFEAFEDKRVAAAGEALASMDVSAGSPSLDVPGDLTQLISGAQATLAKRLFPPQFLGSPLINAGQVNAIQAQLPRLRGRYRLVAKSSSDLYPHSGPFFALDLALEPAK